MLFLYRSIYCYQSSISFDFQDKGVKIIAIGVGNYEDFEGQLEEIAGDNVYNANNFNELSDLFDQILEETCSKLSPYIYKEHISFVLTVGSPKQGPRREKGW